MDTLTDFEPIVLADIIVLGEINNLTAKSLRHFIMPVNLIQYHNIL